jgi:antibiotic biosynthesis monooxygenase (ABM) superfamily enzyme
MTTVASRPAVTAETATAATAAAPRTPARAQAASLAALPSIHTRFLFTWLSVFAALTVAQLLIGPYVMGLPVLLRNLIVTGVVVPAVVYALLPTLLKVRAAVLRRRS